MKCENCGHEINKRTIKQNSALHLYLTLLAKELNDAGLDMKRVIKEDVDIPWTTETAKNYLWRPIQESYLGKKSTTRLNRKQVSEVYDILNRMLGEKLGLNVEFPNND